MSLTLSHESQNYEPIEAGNHVARCIQVVDLGTHMEKALEFPHELRANHKIRISWELPNESKILKDQETGEETTSVSIIGQEFKGSLHENSRLRKTLASWRGRDFTDEELKGFSLDKLLGATCMLNITHTQKDGKKYANVTAVTPLAKGMACPAQINKSLKFEIENFTKSDFDKLPKFVQEKIKKSKEMQSLEEQADSPEPISIADEFANMDAALAEVQTQMPF